MSGRRSGLVDVLTVGVAKIDRSRLIRVLQLATEKAEWNHPFDPTTIAIVSLSRLRPNDGYSEVRKRKNKTGRSRTISARSPSRNMLPTVLCN